MRGHARAGGHLVGSVAGGARATWLRPGAVRGTTPRPHGPRLTPRAHDARRAALNPLAPGSITFFDEADDDCDASAHYVAMQLDHVGEQGFLPGSIWAPARSKITRELDT
ncbi:BP74-related protein [Kitasatospora griseola]